MPLITISSEDRTWATGGSATLRIYATEPFRSSDGTFISGGKVGTDNLAYAEITCPFTPDPPGDGFITIPDVEIYSTDDSRDRPDVRYNAVLYDEDGNAVQNLLLNFQVPSAIASPTTWSALEVYGTTGTLASSGTAYQPLDDDLTAIAGLSPSDDDLLQRKSGAWTNRTPAQVKTDLAITLDNLTDVVLTSPTSGDGLTYNGSQWVNGASSSGLGSLSFTASELQHINCGRFFRSSGHYSHCFWEAWVKPSALQTNPGYIISDTNGGNHCILWGVQQVNSSFYEITGNMTTQVTATTVSSVDTGTDVLTSASHGLYTGAAVVITSTGTVPAPLSSSTIYYALKIDANTFRVCATLADAVATTPIYINLTSVGSGTITSTRQHLTTFGTAETLPYGHWVHLAVGWDGSHIRTWTNGVLTQALVFAPEYRYNGGGNDATLHISGSDHNNFGGNIACVRGYEGYGRCIEQSDFIPELYFRPLIVLGGDLPRDVPQFCMSFQTQMGLYIDAGKFEGTSHHGVPEAVQATGTGSGPAVGYSLSLPVWEAGEIETGTYTPTAPATPSGAIVWDSFSRPDRCYTSPDPSSVSGFFFLGTTEVGNKTWVRLDNGLQATGSGIINGRAFIVNQAPDYGFDTATQDVDVRVNRLPTPDCWTGLVVRYKDANDNYRLLASDTVITVYKIEGGVSSAVAYTVASGWTTLRVTASGTSFNVYTGTATEGTFTSAGSFTGTNVTGATKAGIARPTGANPVYYDNFLVK